VNQNDFLTTLYPRVWPIHSEWQHNGPDASLKWPPQAALNCQIWQFMVPTLNQRLGSLPTESMTAIFLFYRHDYPFPPPINRGGFQGLNMRKISPKLMKNQPLPLVFCHFCPSLSPSFHPSNHTTTNSSTTSSTIESQHNHQPTTKQPPWLSLLLPAFLSPLQTFFFFLP